MGKLSVIISAYSDLDRDARRRRLWGDYWLKFRLGRALRRQGIATGGRSPLVWLHLFGHPMSPPRAREAELRGRMLWIHSHPDLVSSDILDGYDRIYCASRGFADKLRQWGHPTRWLMVPTHMRRLSVSREFDITFVGNARNPGGTSAFEPRPIVRKLLEVRKEIPPATRIGIWGRGWKGLVPPGWYKGEHVPPGQLNALYSASRMILNDHHPDMAREGFFNPRVLDALAAGATAVSDPVSGLEEGLKSGIRIVTSPAELLRAVLVLLASPEHASKQIGRDVALHARRYSFTAAAACLKEDMGGL